MIEGFIIGTALMAGAGVLGLMAHISNKREREAAEAKLAAREAADTALFNRKLSEETKARPLQSPRRYIPAARSTATRPSPRKPNPEPKKESSRGSDFLTGALIGAALSGGGGSPSSSSGSDYSSSSSDSGSFSSGGDFGGGGSSSDF